MGKLTRLIDLADSFVKLAGAAAVTVAIGHAIPGVASYIKLGYGYLYGISGAVYYETGPDDALTEDGHLFLIKHGPRRYDNIQRGDILQANDAVRFRNLREDGEGYDIGPEIFLMSQGQCVVVRHRLDAASITGPPGSGGWLHVSTSACGFLE